MDKQQRLQQIIEKVSKELSAYDKHEGAAYPRIYAIFALARKFVEVWNEKA
jgi:hypothetical protein